VRDGKGVGKKDGKAREVGREVKVSRRERRIGIGNGEGKEGKAKGEKGEGD